MPLPNDFSPPEFLQDLARKTFNREVLEWFRDVPDDPDITTPRGSLKIACTHLENDSLDMTLLRLLLFYMACRKASDFHPAIYGIPIPDYQAEVTFIPQVTLYFSEDWEAVPDTRSPIRAEISFRLVGETSQTMTESKAQLLATKIRSEFASGGGYRWRKGTLKVVYRDRNRGYDLRLLSYSESEGREVINKVLDINGHTLDEDYLSISEAKRNFPTNPGTHIVYGKSRAKYRQRPIGYVRFRYASLKIAGLPYDVVLVDRTGYHHKALIKVA